MEDALNHGRRRGRPRGRPAGSVRGADRRPAGHLLGEQAPDVDEGENDTSPAVTDTATLFLTRVDGDTNRLAPVPEQVPVDTSSTPTPRTALETLLSYTPDEAQQAQGFTATHPQPNTALASSPELDEEGVLLANLNSNIDTIQAEGSRLAFGQIVHGRQLRRGEAGAVPGRRAAPGRLGATVRPA